MIPGLQTDSGSDLNRTGAIPRVPGGRWHGSDRAGGEIKRDKPSAGIRRGEGRARKTWRKEVSRANAAEDNRGEGANKQQAENEKHDL